MKRALMVASVASMIKQFNMNNVEILQNLGYKVDVVCNFEQGNTISEEAIIEFQNALKALNVDYYQIDFSRKPSAMRAHLQAYKKLLQLMNSNTYELLHCHAPISGAIARLIARKKSMRVMYTAHGFQFCKGAPLLSWLLYYPVEWFMARNTDIMITINQEDYEFAKKHFGAKRIEYIRGVGVDTSRFVLDRFDRDAYRTSLKINDTDFVILSVGELSVRKNHKVILDALGLVKDKSFVYLIAGIGALENNLIEKRDRVGLSDKVRLLGYRQDVPELYHIADVFAFPSLREGLPFALVEAMASGLPAIGAISRGITECIEQGVTGFLCKPDDPECYAKAINKLYSDKELREEMARNAKVFAQQYDLQAISSKMKELYTFPCQ